MMISGAECIKWTLLSPDQISLPLCIVWLMKPTCRNQRHIHCVGPGGDGGEWELISRLKGSRCYSVLAVGFVTSSFVDSVWTGLGSIVKKVLKS